MYVMQQPMKWEYYLHLVQFSYNNGYQESFKMILFEVLYGRQCSTPINRSIPETKIMLEQEILAEMEDQAKEEHIKVDHLCHVGSLIQWTLSNFGDGGASSLPTTFSGTHTSAQCVPFVCTKEIYT